MTEPLKKRTEEERQEDLVPVDDASIGRAFRWSLAFFAAIAVVVGVVLYWKHRPRVEEPIAPAVLTGPKSRAELRELTPPEVRFTDVTREAGIDFVHTNGAYGDKLLPETMGSGVAFFDFDGDGKPDLLFVNATDWPGHTPAGKRPPTMALYRNDGGGHFTNVTAGSGLDVPFYGTGVAVGDVDNDGRVDVFVAGLGGSHLFHNLGGGHFEEVTRKAGVGGGPDVWSTAAAFFDYDNDGYLDLFVGNYVRWSKEIDFAVDFRLTGIGRAYGPPNTYEGSSPYLYHNNGDGTFTDVSAKAGVRIENPATHRPMAKTLGVVPIDVDGDGRMDLFVANDTVQNFLLRNRGDGTFEDVAVPAGVAFDRDGNAAGAMGADAAFYRGDDTLAIGVGNFANEMTSFFVSQGTPMLFADEAIAEGIGPPSRLRLKFGLFFFDVDLDGRLDLFEANGHLEDEINKVQPSQHYEQPPQLFWNCGSGCPRTFAEVPPATAGDLARPLVGRGAAFADIDGDGDLDVVITQAGRAPVLLRNDQQLGHHWLRVKLVGRKANRDAIGALIEATAGGVTQRARVMPTRSYLSQVELPVTFGLGTATHVDKLHIVWPGGSVQEVPAPKVDSTMVVTQSE